MFGILSCASFMRFPATFSGIKYCDMGSTGEPERKRRQISSISSPAKRSSFSPFSEDKKLDAVVLQFQNQKLVQQLEAQNVEYTFLENTLDKLEDKQKNYAQTLDIVTQSWEQLVSDLESSSLCLRGSSDNDGASSPTECDFVDRLLKSGVTLSCSPDVSTSRMNDCKQTSQVTSRNIVQNMLSAIHNLWQFNDVLSVAILGSLPQHVPSSEQLPSKGSDLQTEVKSLRTSLEDLHVKHRFLAGELQIQLDTEAKDKSEQKRLAGELECTNAALEESKSELVLLKAQKDNGQRTPYLFPSLGTNTFAGDKAGDKEKEFKNMQFANKELIDLASSRLLDIRSLHEKRIDFLKKLSSLQSTSDIHCISSSKAFHLLSKQLEKSKNEIDQCRRNLEELQVEKDNFTWREREVSIKIELADVFRRAATVSESRIVELEMLESEQLHEKALLESKLEGASREPGRNETIAEFKSLVSLLPRDMNTMQHEMSKFKEDSSELHSLRAEGKSLRNILERKVNELNNISSRSSDQLCEIKKLKTAVKDLEENDRELKLFLEMYKRESTTSRDVMESRDSEYKAWAHVQSLQSSLDEHCLELRVKAANEAEAIAQQKLATAEAEIADLRQKLEASERDLIKLSEDLNSKREEGEAYLSEIESIGQAYEDVQNKNQHLLQQVTERDDYNIKLALESVKTRQVQRGLRMEIETNNREVQHASISLDIYGQKFAMLDGQLRVWSEQIAKLTDDGRQSTMELENTKKRLLDVQNDAQKHRKLLDEMQRKINISRSHVSELHIELEKERFNKKRVEEELEAVTRKALHLRTQTEGLSVLVKLKQELGEYKGILKCGHCHDRQKEVVIAKCFHLFCNPCIRRILESRHRKCPACSTSFGPNDVKPIYI